MDRVYCVISRPRMRVIGTLVRITAVGGTLKAQAARNIGLEEVRSLQDLAVLTELDGAVGHELGQVRRLYFGQDESRFIPDSMAMP